MSTDFLKPFQNCLIDASVDLVLLNLAKDLKRTIILYANHNFIKHIDIRNNRNLRKDS